jgi:2-C-methyl-D-erythritol 4-phosphate cytidylyltransferase
LPAIAVVVAGGAGRRFRSETPKQFLPLGGKPLLAHTLDRFETARSIERIVLVLPGGFLDEAHGLLAEFFGRKPVVVTAGGETRQASVWEGLRRIDEGYKGLVAVHDGARPLVPSSVIDRVVNAASKCEDGGGVIAAVPVVETIKEVTKAGLVLRTVDRERFYRAQTPQCFPCGTLRRACESAMMDGFTGTDEAALVERIGAPVHIVAGSDQSFKVTTPGDLELAERYLERGA